MRRAARWPSVVAVLIGLAGIAVGVVGWFRPVVEHNPTPAAPSYTEQQVSAAKAKACTAFELVDKGTTLQTSSAQGDDPAIVDAHAANARLSLVAGAWYLRDQLDPATPAALATEIRNSTDLMMEMAVNALAGAKSTDPSYTALLDDANAAFDRIEELCK